jgi:hypothetical protein
MSNTTTLNLTVREALALNNALPALNGYTESITVKTTTMEDPNTGQKTTTTDTTHPKQVPYKFGPEGKGGGIARYTIGELMDAFGREEKAFKRAQDSLIIQLSGGTGTINERDQVLMGQFNAEVQKLLDHEIEVKVSKISLGDLNLDGNPDLSPSVLGALMPLIQK